VNKSTNLERRSDIWIVHSHANAIKSGCFQSSYFLLCSTSQSWLCCKGVQTHKHLYSTRASSTLSRSSFRLSKETINLSSPFSVTLRNNFSIRLSHHFKSKSQVCHCHGHGSKGVGMENDGKLAEAWWSRVWQTMKLPRGFEELEVLTNFETARFAGNLKPGSGGNTQAVGVTIIRVSRNGKPENHYQCNWELQRKLGLRMESCDGKLWN